MSESRIKETRVFKKELLLKSTSDDALEEREFLFNKITYDNEGRTISESTYGPDGELQQEATFRYNANGLMEEEKSQDADGMIVEHKTFEYSQDGKVLKELRHYMDGSADAISYLYNEKGELSGKKVVDPDGDVEVEEQFSYTNGLVSHHTVKDADGELVSEKKITYNDKGDPVSIYTFDSSEAEATRKEIDYYDSGNRKQTLVYNEDDELIERVLMKENDQGHLVQVVEETALKKNTVNFTLDEHGNIIAQEEFDRNGDLISKVMRIYDGGKRLLSSDVFIHGGGRGLSRNYTLRQEYDFW